MRQQWVGGYPVGGELPGGGYQDPGHHYYGGGGGGQEPPAAADWGYPGPGGGGYTQPGFSPAAPLEAAGVMGYPGPDQSAAGSSYSPAPGGTPVSSPPPFSRGVNPVPAPATQAHHLDDAINVLRNHVDFTQVPVSTKTKTRQTE